MTKSKWKKIVEKLSYIKNSYNKTVIAFVSICRFDIMCESFHWHAPFICLWLTLLLPHVMFNKFFIYFTLKAFNDKLRSIKGINPFKIESLVERRFFPTVKLLILMVLNVVCLDVKVWLKLSWIQSSCGVWLL